MAKRISVTEACERVEGIFIGLEEGYREWPGQLSGMRLVRVKPVRTVCRRLGLPVVHPGMVWCLTMGSPNETEFYGETLVDCLCKAQEGRHNRPPVA